LETLELRGLPGSGKLRFPRKIRKTNDLHFTASDGWRQNIGNMGVMVIPSHPHFRFQAADAGQIVKDRRLSYR